MYPYVQAYEKDWLSMDVNHYPLDWKIVSGDGGSWEACQDKNRLSIYGKFISMVLSVHR